MKTTMTFICALALCMCSFFAQGQVSPEGKNPLPGFGAQAPAPILPWRPLETTKYVATDIHGKKYDLGAILKSDKKILIDFSALWCGPCWTLHDSGKLDSLYLKYGPSGTDELVILWVEVEGATIEAINDADVTNGGKWPIPVISDQWMARTLGIVIPYVPTVVLLSPAGEYTDIYREVMQGPDAVHAAMEACLTSKDKPRIKSVNIPKRGAVAGKPIFLSAKVESVPDITAYKWEMEGATPATSTEKAISVKWSKTGTYKIKLTVTNTNGSSEYSGEITVGEGHEIKTFPYKESFDTGLDPSWTLLDGDRDGYNWMTLSDVFLPLGLAKDSLPVLTYSGSDCMSSWSYFPLALPNWGNWVGKPLTAENYLITPAINFPANAVKPEISYFIRNFVPKSLDWYKVLVSTTGTAEADFTDEILPFTKPSGDIKGGDDDEESQTRSSEVLKNDKYTWTREVIDLTKYKGKRIFVAFVHSSDNKFGLLLDDFTAGIDGTLSADPISRPEDLLNIYVNPQNETIEVAGDGIKCVRIFDVAGCPISTVAGKGTPRIAVDASAYRAGVYIVRVETSRGDVIRKVIVR